MKINPQTLPSMCDKIKPIHKKGVSILASFRVLDKITCV
jgi:hypothetical protein